MTCPSRPELVLCDMDGCLSKDKGFPFDLDAMSKLRDLIHSSGIPFALATGRSDPYVEAVTQALDITTPCMCEHGCYLYFPSLKRPKANSCLTPAGQELMDHLRRTIEAHCAQLNCFTELKRTCLSIHPCRQGKELQSDLELLIANVKALITPEQLAELQVNRSSCTLDIVPRGCDKGAGAWALCQTLRVSPNDALAIGDSEIDLPMMAVCGLSAAPGNARSAVKERTGWLAPSENIFGVLEILDRFFPEQAI